MFGRARLRLALFSTAAMVTILGAVGVTAYLVLRGQLDDEINGSLETAASGLRATPVFASSPAPLPAGNDDDHGDDSRRFPDRELRNPLSTDIFYLVVRSDGTVVNNPRGVDLDGFPLAELARTGVSGQVSREFDGDPHRYRVLSLPSNDPRNPNLVLIVGRSLDARDHQLDVLLIVLAVGGIAGTVLAAGGGFWLAGRALIPIRRALETQRRFVSDASHELRTPVAVMKANAELLLRHPDQTIARNTDQVEAINEEADHMGRLVGDLLTLARADEQRVTLAHEPLDLASVLETVVRDMGALAQSRGVTLRSELAPAPVTGDEQRLGQLARILADNALKFTPAGGTVSVRSWREGHRSNFLVADTGPGIPLADQPRVFDRFFRSDEARSPEGGIGLGLAIGQWIAEAHGGRITLESEPGHGAAFIVRLPAGRRRGPAVAPESGRKAAG